MAGNNNTLDIAALIESTPHARLQLAIPGPNGRPRVISGFVQEPFSVAGAAMFEGNAIADLTAGIDQKKNTAAMLANSTGAGFGQGSIQGRAATNRLWSSSDPAQFPVNFLLIAHKEDIDVRADVAALLGCVYPAGDVAGDILGMQAPMGYMPAVSSAENTATLVVGSWFRADGLLVDDVAAEFSKEVTRKGVPLYATVAVTLSPWRTLYSTDVAQYLAYGQQTPDATDNHGH